MNMRWSLFLGKVSGIGIYIHWTFWILVIWIFLMYYRSDGGLAGGLLGVLFIFALFACVVLHELGHAITAKRFKIVTKNITLLPIGGLANMERLPDKPGQELLVAIMGPMVNVVIAIILYLVLHLTGMLPSMEELQAIQEAEQATLAGSYFLFNLMVVNVILVVFNLIPAFPMDGGRVLRALLSYSFDRAKATNIAARIGHFLAILFVFAGFYTNFWLVFIGIFIFLGAGGEANYETARSIVSNYKVKDVLMTQFTLLSPQDTLAAAVKSLLDGQEQEFLVGEDGTVQGVLTRNNIIEGLSEFGKKTPLSTVMRKDFMVLKPEMELEDVMQKMMTSGYTISPVIDNARLIGIVNTENINELIMVNKAMAK